MHLKSLFDQFIISPSAPAPVVLSNLHSCYLCYFLQEESLRIPETAPISNVGSDYFTSLRFTDCLEFNQKLVVDGDWTAVRYFEQGIGSNEIFQLIDSDYLQELGESEERQDFSEYNHYLICFSEIYFEFIAKKIELVPPTTNNIKEQVSYWAERL